MLVLVWKREVIYPKDMIGKNRQVTKVSCDRASAYEKEVEEILLDGM